MNQLATPGLGSLMAGRTLSGLGQIAIAVCGAALVLLWFVLTMIQTYQQITTDTPRQPYGWVGAAGALVFVVAWCWSLATSVSLLREAGKESPADSSNAPPHITNPPGKM